MSQEISKVATKLTEELNIPFSSVNAAIHLLDDGCTVPFIARYRKEATGGLTDTQLRVLSERLYYLRELNLRRTSILDAIRVANQLTPELEQAIHAAETKTQLEDLYQPFRPKRRTKASIAIDAGLLPLATTLLEHRDTDLITLALSFINIDANIPDVNAVLEGVQQILMEKFSEDAGLLNEIRQYLWENGILKSESAKTKKGTASKNMAHKYTDYVNYEEPIKKIPSHRALALFRGRREQVIQFSLTLPQVQYGEQRLAKAFNIDESRGPIDAWLMETVRLTWKLKLLHKLESELFARLRELADDEAIRVFTRNLRDLLLAAPAGRQVTMGLDPGIRTGVKVAVVDDTGKVLNDAVIYPFAPQNEWHESIATLAKLAAKYHVHFVSIGNGTGSRDTSRLVTELIKRYPDMHLVPVLVNEAGASVYSASELAGEELSDLDVTIRGAVSIARRLQDPLAELVKIEPKAIGVGQYQHDVNQSRLLRRLHEVVEDCVNLVGVDINTASVSLLTYISGLNEALAKNIVAYRNEHGPFQSREQFKAIPRMGEKTFEQAAGFLRIYNGTNPLDASGVHPETYPLVERIAHDLALSINDLVQNVSSLKTLEASRYVDAQHGLPTIQDVLLELEKPGRDPRPEFKTPIFQEGVEDISHLKIGMMLEGVVSNVTNFGAFVDVGVHQDGLVHISALTDSFVKDPHNIVKAGDIVKVRVIEVDVERRRIGLSMKLKEPTIAAVPKPVIAPKPPKPKAVSNPKKVIQKPNQSKIPFNTAMADALAKLKGISS